MNEISEEVRAKLGEHTIRYRASPVKGKAQGETPITYPFLRAGELIRGQLGSYIFS